MSDEKKCKKCESSFDGDDEVCPTCKAKDWSGLGVMGKEDLDRIKSQKVDLGRWFDDHPPGNP